MTEALNEIKATVESRVTTSDEDAQHPCHTHTSFPLQKHDLDVDTWLEEFQS